MFRLTDVVKNLLLLNVIVFLAVLLDQSFGSPLGLQDLLALHYPASDRFEPVQIATHFFMHGGVFHIFFNMFALAIFGPPLETQWGPKRFLLYYFICAFGAAALHMGYSWYEFSQMQAAIDAFQANPSLAAFQEYFDGISWSGFRAGDQLANTQLNIERGLRGEIDPGAVQTGVELMSSYLNVRMDVPIVGASGAIYGLLLAFGMHYPNVKLMLLFLPVPIKAKYFIPIMMAIELFLGFQQYAWDNIAHFAHLGGAITGFLLILYWRKFGSPWRPD